MKKGVGIALIFLGVVGLAYLAYRYVANNQRPNSELTESDLDNYQQDEEAEREMLDRTLSFASKHNNLILFNLTGEENFSDGYFPLTHKKEVIPKGEIHKWSKDNRKANGQRIKLLVSNFDKYVADASEVHRVPRIVIYGLMGIEHKDSVSVAQAVTSSSGSFIGLMQASVVTANDTLKRGVQNKQLSKKQVEFFKNKIGKNIDTISKADLQDAEINIHVGAAFLSVLIRKYGLDDLHKVIFCYNRGEFKLSKGGTSGLGIDALIDYYKNTSDHIGAEYVIRALGENGSFDILYNDLKIKD